MPRITRIGDSFESQSQIFPIRVIRVVRGWLSWLCCPWLSFMSDGSDQSYPIAVPDKPALEGLEQKWTERWEADALYRFDRTRPRDEVYAIDTPPPTVSGSLHVGHVFSYTHTDVSPAFSGCAGRPSSTRWDGTTTGLPTERRVQNYFGVRCDPSLPFDPVVHAAGQTRQAADPGIAAELHRALRAADGRGREGVRTPVASSGSVGRLGDDLRHDRPAGAAALATVVSAAGRARSGVSARSADALGCRFPDGRRAGRARRSRTTRRLPSDSVCQIRDSRRGSGFVEIDTTGPS